MEQQDNDAAQVSVKPAWLAPAFIVAVIIAVYLAGKKKEEAVENPLVDLVIITIGVFAIAAVGRKVGAWLNAPGMATFFGAPVQPHPDHVTETHVTDY